MMLDLVLSYCLRYMYHIVDSAAWSPWVTNDTWRRTSFWHNRKGVKAGALEDGINSKEQKGKAAQKLSPVTL